MIEQPDFPSQAYGYVAFRAPHADPERFGRHIYSTPFETNREKLIERVTKPNPRVAPTLLVARFELVEVEAVRLRG